MFFHGVPLNNIAGARVTEITLTPIQWSATARARPILAGADFVRLTGGTRTVTMTFAMLEKDAEIRQEQIMAISGWLRTDEPQPLVLPGHPGRYLNAICTEFPEAYAREWWQELRATWTCFDPYWTSMTEKSAACGTEIRIAGSAPPYMRITDTLTASADRTYTDGTDTMTFEAVPAGDLEIDLEKQTASVNGSSIMSGYTFASSFIVPHAGSMTITGSGTVRWRERWV